MTAVQLTSKSPAHRRWPLFLLLLSAGLLPLFAWAESSASLPATVRASEQSEEKPKDDYWWSDRFDPVRFNSSTASHYFLTVPDSEAARPHYVFLPPIPPPLGADFPILGRLVPGAPPAPPELAAFVNELFYPQFGARLAANEMAKAEWQQIQTYRAARTELQNELRSRIAELKDAEGSTRERQLADLALLQASRINALEVAAEKIRIELQPTGWSGFPTAEEMKKPDSSAATRWTPQDLRLESDIFRHAAYHAKELSRAQRHLLLEAAIEIESHADSTRPASSISSGARLLFFSPATSRIKIPTGLAEPLEKLIDDYTATKNGLKAELQEAILNNEPTGESRSKALKRLAVAQAPGFAAIEAMAEEIRRGLSSLPNLPGPPAPPALPPVLMDRIATYRKHKLEMLRTLHGMLAGVRENVDPATGRTKSSDPSALGLARHGAGTGENKPVTLQQSVTEFNLKQTALLAELNKETQGIREALAEYVRTTGRPDDRKSIDDLLKDFESARQKQELWDKYRDYQVAVLMPGLAPEQRRLLFDAAVEQLALPLPPGRTGR